MIAFESDDDGRIRVEIYGETYIVPTLAVAQLSLDHYMGGHLVPLLDGSDCASGIGTAPTCPLCKAIRAAIRAALGGSGR